MQQQGTEPLLAGDLLGPDLFPGGADRPEVVLDGRQRQRLPGDPSGTTNEVTDTGIGGPLRQSRSVVSPW